MKVTNDMIDVLSDVLNTIATQLIEECEPEDFENPKDLLQSTLYHIEHDFDEYNF